MSDDLTKMFESFMKQGQDMASAFVPAMETFDPKGFEKIFQTLSPELMELWFGKTLNSGGLDARTRLLVTIAAMTVLGAGAESQLRITLRHALAAGASQREIAEVIYQMSMFGGLPATNKALEIAQSVFAEEEKPE
ncbi:MAG: carboxymuconolactone decarboxylase family protein [Proteobacteria bacterium]|nr:carboxymuconolactone decarboxylase family protein [Pseudomonadota bacterium]